jgi:hypothetical protein
MATLSFEDLGTQFQVTGSAEVYEETSPRSPTTIIRRDQAWKVEFDWRSVGSLNHMIAGTWNLRVYLEQMGAPEFNLPAAANVAIVPNLTSSSYNRDILIPTNTVPTDLYKLVTSITCKNPLDQPDPIAGFAERPLVQFYDAV